jgi:beta-lactamase class D
MIKKFISIFFVVSCLVSCSKNLDLNAQKYFDEYKVKGCFVLYDLKKDKYHIYNSSRAHKRFYPASTFKILNTIAALETKVAKDENFFLKWDGVSGVIPSHKQDHTLKLAFQNSTLWFYQEIARRVGLEHMQEIVDKAKFGNREIGNQIDQFWLEGPLRISALEYIEFLKGVHLEAFAFDKETYTKAKKIFIEEKNQDYILRAKTGTTVFAGEQLCWYVGYIERSDNTYFFAMNVSSPRPDNFLEGQAIKSRVPLTLKILKEEFKI